VWGTALHIDIQVTKITINTDVEVLPLRMALNEADRVTGLSSFRKINAAPRPRYFIASNVTTNPIIRNLVLKGLEQGCTIPSSQVDRESKSRMAAPSTSVHSTEFPSVILLRPRILRWLPDFSYTCAVE
jgi:hypothetical protein